MNGEKMSYTYKSWVEGQDANNETIMVAEFKNVRTGETQRWAEQNVVRAASGFNRFGGSVSQAVFKEALINKPR